jgi:hypothetical protein
MHEPYLDIRNRAGEPGWYSPDGVPRYSEFSPALCGVYNSHVAFVRIECQCCGHVMLVASVWERFIAAAYGRTLALPKREDVRDPWDAIGSFHYGDPPYHGCIGAGETMNSIPLEVLQFWKREPLGNWERDPAYEFVLPVLERRIEL